MKVLTFGEILLRLSAPEHTRLFQKDYLESSFCGGEANVAVSLANFGVESAFLTKLPQNAVSNAAVGSLRYFGVDVQKIVYGDGRMGVYYLEKGASQRASKVIYDRKYSAIAMARREEFNWEHIFHDIDWFHWTGITPALSDELVEICLEACKYAKRNNITVSCDLNYRRKLWKSEKAQNVMFRLMPYVDVCIANEEDAEKMLGICLDSNDVEKGVINRAGYTEVAKQICSCYACKVVAFTLRESYSASMNGWGAMLFDAKEDKSYYSRRYEIQIVDRVGSGDSFAAGVIYGLLMYQSNQEIIEFATAASCLKHTIEGDYNRVSLGEIRDLMECGGNGRVQR